MTEICESHGKEKGGPWECYYSVNFYGWEAERVVVVTHGFNILEMVTRAKTELILILVTPITHIKENIKAAANKGLVDVEVNERENQIENSNLNLQDSDTAARLGN